VFSREGQGEVEKVAHGLDFPSAVRELCCITTISLRQGKLNCPFTRVKENVVLTKNYSVIDRTRWKVYRECIVWSVKNRIKYNQKGIRDFEI